MEFFKSRSHCGGIVYLQTTRHWNFLSAGQTVVATVYLQVTAWWILFPFRSQRGRFCFPSCHSVVDSVSLPVTAWWILFPSRSQRGGFCFSLDQTVVELFTSASPFFTERSLTTSRWCVYTVTDVDRGVDRNMLVSLYRELKKKKKFSAMQREKVSCCFIKITKLYLIDTNFSENPEQSGPLRSL